MQGGSIPPSSTKSGIYQGKYTEMDGGVVPPSNTRVDQGRCGGIVALIRLSTVETSAGEAGYRSRGTEIGRMTSGDPSIDVRRS